MSSFALTRSWILILCCLPRLCLAELQVREISPANDAKNACIDTPLRITFGATPALGSKGRIIVRRATDGQIVDTLDLGDGNFTNSFGGKTLRYEPFTIEGNTVSIQLHSHCLSYGQDYEVQIEPGVFKDAAGRDFAGLDGRAAWKFSTKTTQVKGKTNIVVAADQSGDFCTLQGAIDSTPDDNQVPITVTIRKGVYNGITHIATGKNHIRITGEDRTGTILQGFDNDRLNSGRGGRALIGVDANDFILENLTVHNTTPYKGSQAEALRINGERCIVRNADLLSFQDTLMLGGRVYVTNCYVEGDVDFIWGPGIAFFEDCELKAAHAGYYLQARNPVGQAGYVFSNCRLTSAPGVEKCWLARIHSERFPGSHVAFLNCKMGAHIMPAGWVVDGTNYAALRFQEFRSTDLHGKPLDITKRHPASHQLTEAEAAALSDPAKVFAYPETWDPRTVGAQTGSLTRSVPTADAQSSVLRVGDTLVVRFSDLGVRDVPPVETRIKEDGSITLLYNKHFKAANKTVSELESDIRSAYASPSSPNVSVDILNCGFAIYVGGAVKNAGYQRPWGKPTVVDMIALAGGFKDANATHKIQLIRANGQKLYVDYAKALKQPELNLEVFLGDEILVAQRINPSSTLPKIFDVRDFGAKGDGTVLDTPAIQQALDECGKSGGGIVRLGPGTYLSKPIYLRSKTTLQIDEGATLKATDEQADYLRSADSEAGRSSAAFVAFVNGRDLTDIAIVGKGTIDGSGARWWEPAKAAKRTHTENPGYTLPRPRMVVLTGCKNVRVQGVTLANSPCFHLVPVQCEDVDIEDVTIISPADSPNTDGIDPSMSRHVRITRCRIDTGDDNIAIKSGHRLEGREFACEDITVTDCTFLHGHGMSIGSETAGGVRNLTVRHCTFEGTQNGIRIKSPRGRGGAVEALTYTDITMTNVDPAITITCYYPKVPKEDTAQAVTAGTPKFRNIRISNLTAISPRSAGTIVGLPESPVAGVVLENVHINAATGLLVRNAKDIRTKGLEITAAQGPPLLLENAQVDGAGDLKEAP